MKGQVAEYTSSFALALKSIVLAVADGLFGLCVDLYWAVQRNWFARVNALCNLSRKKLREVAASLPGRFLSRPGRCFTLSVLNLELRSSTNATTVEIAKITAEKGWRVGKKCICVCVCVCNLLSMYYVIASIIFMVYQQKQMVYIMYLYANKCIELAQWGIALQKIYALLSTIRTDSEFLVL